MGDVPEDAAPEDDAPEDEVLAGYAAAATPGLIARYEAFDPAALLAPVRDLLPPPPARVADIGAGTGRDAAWFAAHGYAAGGAATHPVVAVEPVAALREAGIARHRDLPIRWLDDRLPGLALAAAHGPFDLVTVCGVWHHLRPAARDAAMAALGRLTAPGGLLVMSLRHGPSAPGRPAFPLSADDTVAAAARAGFALLRRVETDSIQPGNRALGVRWTWLAFEIKLKK